MENPLDQFKLVELFRIDVLGHALVVTNSTVLIVVAALVINVFILVALRKREIIPGRLQSFVEILHSFILSTLNDNTMGRGEKYLPFIFSLFTIILTLNLFGMIPYTFAVTSHISVTFALAVTVFLTVTILGFATHGVRFLSLFLPAGVPWVLAPMMIVIELFTYLTRPISLSIRLAANMMIGHVLLAVIAGFVAVLGFWGWLPISFVALLTGFEIFVAVLQAYIFTILTCVYLNDAINLH